MRCISFTTITSRSNLKRHFAWDVTWFLVFLILVSVTKVILRYHYFYKYLLIPFHVIHGAREVMNTRNENSHVFFYSQLREKETNIAIRARAHL